MSCSTSSLGIGLVLALYLLAAPQSMLPAQELPGVAQRQAGTIVESLRSGTLTWPERPEAHQGGDLRLPAWLPAENPCGGFYQLWGRSTDPRLGRMMDLAALPELTWAELEPEPGVYRFDLLERGTAHRLGLGGLRASGRRGILWFMAWREGDVPAWVLRRHRLDPITVKDHEGSFRVVPVWRAGPRADLLKAIAALGDRLKDDPACGAVYLPTLGNASGECYPTRDLLEKFEAGGDRIEGTWLQFHLDLLRTWVAHLGPEKGVWVSIDAPLDGRHRSQDGDRRERLAYTTLIDAVLRAGLSSRSGGTDSITNHVTNGWLLAHDGTGRRRARHLPLRFFGNEAEEFLAPCFAYFEAMVDAGVAQGFTHWLFDDAMFLRLAEDPAALAVFDARYAGMLDHLRRTAGWPPELAPQAVVALGEMDVRSDRIFDRDHPWPMTAGTLRRLVNHGWCLDQIDGDGARSKPALRRDWRLDETDLAALRDGYDRLVKVPGSRARMLAARVSGLDARAATEALCHGVLGLTLHDGVTHTWAGRSTDQATGQNRLDFRTDPRFLAPGHHRVVIQATVLSGGQTWALKVPGQASIPAPVLPVDGHLWTVSFGVAALPATAEGATFALEHHGGRDLVVQRVRVLRWDAPPEFAAGATTLAQRRHALWAARHTEEIRTIEAAAVVAKERAARIAQADPQRVAALRSRLEAIRRRAEADLGKALAAAARQGLDLMALRDRHDQALAWILEGDVRAGAAVAALDDQLR